MTLLGQYMKKIGSNQAVTLVHLLFIHRWEKGSSTLLTAQGSLGQSNPVNTVQFICVTLILLFLMTAEIKGWEPFLIALIVEALSQMWQRIRTKWFIISLWHPWPRTPTPLCLWSLSAETSGVQCSNLTRKGMVIWATIPLLKQRHDELIPIFLNILTGDWCFLPWLMEPVSSANG